jgi:hypothetical protein
MEENKKIIAIDVNKLIIRTYNKIAIWNNQSASDEEKSMMLKALSHDIVSDIITTAFSNLEGTKVREEIIPEQPKKLVVPEENKDAVVIKNDKNTASKAIKPKGILYKLFNAKQSDD